MIDNNPQRDLILELQNAEEEAWMLVQHTLIAKHEAKLANAITDKN